LYTLNITVYRDMTPCAAVDTYVPVWRNHPPPSAR